MNSFYPRYKSWNISTILSDKKILVINVSRFSTAFDRNTFRLNKHYTWTAHRNAYAYLRKVCHYGHYCPILAERWIRRWIFVNLRSPNIKFHENLFGSAQNTRPTCKQTDVVNLTGDYHYFSLRSHLETKPSLSILIHLKFNLCTNIQPL
jgi:hypothetical protein